MVTVERGTGETALRNTRKLPNLSSNQIQQEAQRFQLGLFR